ncbi:hypothetical protein [Rhodoplanes roseus]|uniref:ApeA N-terminal domain-containing protein n=1 Tax=Rhodoplanes roseus TaxID=29409 RepID=A0A327KRY2_9BRAD|nr:hypothetical protein [Rhodoplanes roseus]RAI40694.1 hypothetical protein CH341_23245 [Rhodoplanes roseus]
MSGAPLAKSRVFPGTLSRGAHAVEVSAEIGIDASGELKFDFPPIPLSNQSKFILLEWDDKDKVVHFSFRAAAEDGTRFETDHLFFSSLCTTWDQASGARLMLSALCAMGILRFTLNEPMIKPVLRLRLRGFRSFDSLNAACPLGQLEMMGLREDKDDNEASGWLTIQANDPRSDPRSWRAASERLLDHIRCIMSLTGSAYLGAPVMEFIAGIESEVTVWSKIRQGTSALAIIHYMTQEAMFEAAVRSFFSPPIEAKHLFVAIEWFSMEATYNEVRLVNAMTALENLIDSNLGPDEALILPRAPFTRTRRVLLSVIRRCLARLPAEQAEDAARELNEKLAELNRRSLLRKLELLAARWKVPLDGIDPASLQLAKKARDKVVHRGQYYEDVKETDADLWIHVTVIREVVVRFLFTAIGYRGRYISHLGGYRDAAFPPTPAAPD